MPARKHSEGYDAIAHQFESFASALETDRGLFQGAPELRPNEARLAASRARKTAQEFRDKAIESRSRGD